MSKKESDTVRSANVNRTGAIVVAIIGLIGTLVVAYWQFVLKPGDHGQSAKTEYTGRVLDANTLQPIAGAEITLNLKGVPPIVYTDSEGTYHFQLEISSEISGQIRVEAPGYQVYLRNITISPGRTVMEDIRLTP